MAKYSPNVECAEVAGSVSESFDDERGLMKASVQLRCAWADRHLLVADVCGQRRQWPNGAPGAVPKAATAAIVPEVSHEGGLTKDEQIVVWQTALVTVNYTTEFVDVVSESIEPYVEFATLDYQLFRWGAGNGQPLSEDEAPGKLIRGINFVRSEMNKTDLNGIGLDLIGSVNDSLIIGSILTLPFAAETLLYAPPSINYKKDSLGTTKFDITKKFTHNQNGWNAYYRGTTGTYQRIYRRGLSVPYNSYPVADISGLFL